MTSGRRNYSADDQAITEYTQELPWEIRSMCCSFSEPIPCAFYVYVHRNNGSTVTELANKFGMKKTNVIATVEAHYGYLFDVEQPSTGGSHNVRQVSCSEAANRFISLCMLFEQSSECYRNYSVAEL